MARILIVGCGCRGQLLARDLVAAGHAVRGTTRARANGDAISSAGADPYVGDPDRVSTLMGALDGVTVVCWLLASASGEPERVAELHGPRLRFFLAQLVDTPVRGFLYEARGRASGDALRAGAELAREAGATWEIPIAVLDSDPADPASWLGAARAAVDGLLAAR